MKELKRILLVCLVCGMSICTLKMNQRISTLESSPSKPCVIRALPNLIDKAKESTVHIRVNNQWQGSGVIIDEHTVLTAGHVVDGAECVEIMLNDGYFLRAESWYKDPDNDCGILKFKEKFLPSRVSKLAAQNSITVGDPILIVGSPYGDTFFNDVAFGIVAGLGRNYSDFWSDIITLDLAGNPGFSGGPVFNMDGEIIGLVVGTYSQYGNGTIAVPVHILQEMVNNERAGIIKTTKPDTRSAVPGNYDD